MNSPTPYISKPLNKVRSLLPMTHRDICTDVCLIRAHGEASSGVLSRQNPSNNWFRAVSSRKTRPPSGWLLARCCHLSVDYAALLQVEAHVCIHVYKQHIVKRMPIVRSVCYYCAWRYSYERRLYYERNYSGLNPSSFIRYESIVSGTERVKCLAL